LRKLEYYSESSSLDISRWEFWSQPSTIVQEVVKMLGEFICSSKGKQASKRKQSLPLMPIPLCS